jgi:hypothetical protein
LIRNKTADTLHLTNGISVEVRASDHRRLRGPSFCLVVLDEAAFLMSDESSANPDYEIVTAIRPALATTNGQLFMISSPYGKKGVLWDTWRKNFGADGDPAILVAQGTSKVFNSTLRQSFIDRQYERDPVAAAAEFGAQFRTDIQSFVSAEVVAACVERGVFERAPVRRGIQYVGFADPSGGSQDSFALAIGHYDHTRQSVVLDCLREITAPFSPESAVETLCATLREYNIRTIQGDRYAGEWPREAFIRFNVAYEPFAQPKSDLYRDCLPLLNSQRVVLLDHPKLVNQLTSLERRTARGGKDSIDHPPSGRDDVANSFAGLCGMLRETAQYADWHTAYGEPETSAGIEKAARDFRAQRFRSYLYACGMPFGVT